MPDMIERVAVAMYDVTAHPGTWLIAPSVIRGYWRERARAAVAAMRDPTDLMVREGDVEVCSNDVPDCLAGAVWRAMIDAALSTEQQAEPVQ